MRRRRPHSNNQKDQKPRPYCETTKCAKFHAHSFAVYGRGGALLHPRGLAAAQGFSGRAMLAPTIELQNSDIFLRKLCLLLVGACIAGPPTVRGDILGSAGAANAGRASPAPTVKSRNSAYNHTRISRPLVGVGLCSTRGALRQHRALAGEPCSTIRRNTEMQGFLRGPESFARRGLHRRPANGAPSFWHFRNGPVFA